MFFERDLEAKLLDWKNRKNSKPLIIKSARQVGKTSLIKNFGHRFFSDMAYFNFNEKPDKYPAFPS